ncbi:MAG TPA: hypothetical protein PKY59_06315 [Pyrinomonadaceae bacterium]|nr:hypothetical protein [Pyrinomonadaceae bacterium]
MTLEEMLYRVARFLAIYGIFPTFIFFYTFTLGLRDAISNLKIREITKALFNKIV